MGLTLDEAKARKSLALEEGELVIEAFDTTILRATEADCPPKQCTQWVQYYHPLLEATRREVMLIESGEFAK